MWRARRTRLSPPERETQLRRTKMILPSFRCLLILALLCACSSLPSGTRRPRPAQDVWEPGTVRVPVDADDGLRVLWNDALHMSDFTRSPQAWAAGSRAQLELLWEELGWPLPLPELDFHRHVVFGIGTGGRVCPSKLIGADVTPRGLIWIRGRPFPGACVDLLSPVAQVVAVPRRLLGSDVVVMFFDVGGTYAFKVPAAQ